MKQAQGYLISAFQQQNGLKVWVVMDVAYSKALDAELHESTLQLSAKSFTIHSVAQIPNRLQQLANELKVRNENLLRLQSFLNLVEIKATHLHLAEHNPLTHGASYVDLPPFLARKGAIINVKKQIKGVSAMPSYRPCSQLHTICILQSHIIITATSRGAASINSSIQWRLQI